jgi:glycosyltransferase involved in cell wall biosynthesis
MRVCHVSPHLPPDQAANALLPATLGAATHAAGGTTVFVAHEPSQGRRDEQVPLPGTVFRVPRRDRSASVRRWLRLDALSLSRQIAAAMDRAAADADVVHLHSNGLIVEAAASWCRRRGKPHLLTLYGTEIWHYRRRWPIDPFTRAYFRAGAVTFYSGGLRDRAQELGLDRPGMQVIYPAVSDAFVPLDDTGRAAERAALGIAESRVLLNVKRLHPLAGQHTLIDAFARVAAALPDVRLVICGTGPLLAELQARATAARVADRVTFTGLVQNDRVARYAAAADAFVLPSLLEAMPTVAVEALAAGTPVISADHPGGLELHALFGADVRIVPKRDVEALAAAMTEAVRDPRRVAPEAFTIVRDRFSPAAIARAYDEVYARVDAGR